MRSQYQAKIFIRTDRHDVPQETNSTKIFISTDRHDVPQETNSTKIFIRTDRHDVPQGTNSPKIFISTDRHDVPQGTNSSNFITFHESLTLAGKPFRVARGRYQGIEERSFVLEHSIENMGIALESAKVFNQDSILVLDNEGRGTLVYIDGRPDEVIGFINVGTERPQGDFTKIGSQYITFR